MPQEFSFDIVAEVDLAEVQNAHNTSLKQIQNRYDFKGKTAKLTFDKTEKAVSAEGSDDYVVEQMMSIFYSQLSKRGVDLKAFDLLKTEPASGGGTRKVYAIRDTIKQDDCKKITKAVKEAKMRKVKASIQGESVRISGQSKDDLQAVQTMVRNLDLPCPIRFVNYR